MFSYVYFHFVCKGLLTIILVFVVYPVTVTLVECIFFISELTTKGSAECFTFRLLSYSRDTGCVCHMFRLAETRKRRTAVIVGKCEGHKNERRALVLRCFSMCESL